MAGGKKILILFGSRSRWLVALGDRQRIQIDTYRSCYLFLKSIIYYRIRGMFMVKS